MEANGKRDESLQSLPRDWGVSGREGQTIDNVGTYGM